MSTYPPPIPMPLPSIFNTSYFTSFSDPLTIYTADRRYQKLPLGVSVRWTSTTYNNVTNVFDVILPFNTLQELSGPFSEAVLAPTKANGQFIAPVRGIYCLQFISNSGNNDARYGAYFEQSTDGGVTWGNIGGGSYNGGLGSYYNSTTIVRIINQNWRIRAKIQIGTSQGNNIFTQLQFTLLEKLS